MRHAATAKTTLRARFPVWRARLVLGCIAVGLAAVLGRALYLQGVNEEFLQGQGVARFERVQEIPAKRGTIVDRDGTTLASSIETSIVWAVRRDGKGQPITPTAEEIEQVAPLIGLTVRELRAQLADPQRERILLTRRAAPDQVRKIPRKIKWVAVDPSFRREYPAHDMLVHVLGILDVNGKGQFGVERALERQLEGQDGARRVVKDRRGDVVDEPQTLRAARHGEDVRLAIDDRIQSLAYRALGQAMTEHRAKGGGIVVVDPATGEILALVNLPTFDPDNRGRLTPQQLRNRAIEDSFEPGSTLKAFPIALGLELKRIAPGTVLDTPVAGFDIGGKMIRDSHPLPQLSVRDVITKSSNIGSAQVAMKLSPQEMWRMLSDVGFGSAPRLPLPGETGGLLRPYKSWKPIEQATMSYGHGIAVSLVQLAGSYTVFARDGDVVPLSLFPVDKAPEGKRVISPATAQEMRRMLATVVSPRGTAPRAQMPGYTAAGKTGTARKLAPSGGYVNDRHIASFVGFAPAMQPRLVVAVMIDEPRAGQYYGGLVAAPVFAQVMQGALRLLGVPPDTAIEPIKLPPAGEELRDTL